MISIKVKTDAAPAHKTDCLVVFCRKEERPGGVLKDLDKKLNGALASAYKDQRFEGNAGQILWLDTLGLLDARAIALVGVGEAKDAKLETFRQGAGSLATLAKKNKSKTVSFLMPTTGELKGFDASIKGVAIAGAASEGALLGLYSFDEYKSKDKKDKKEKDASVQSLVLLTTTAAQTETRKAATRASLVSQGVYTTRNLGAHPGNTATPTYLAKEAQRLARAHKMTCKILKQKDMEKLGMGSLLGVSRGSNEPPAFIILEHWGAAKSKAPIVVVGKGVTFDTGGISLKPGASMDEMKMDMMGGAATIGLMQAVASLNLKTNVVGIIPAVENMPDGRAIKPGDILKSMSGKTIEVLNTDAEGRLILADALTYATTKYKPRAVIDMATLTGAVLMALGHHAAAVVDTNAALAQELIDSGERSGERAWRLPLWDEYEKGVKSDIADLKNIASPGVGAGTILGGAFLKQFVEGDVPWAHIDIAGVAWGDGKPYNPNKGPSGYGVRLLVDYLEHLKG